MPNENGSANPFATDLTGSIKDTDNATQPLENPESLGESEIKEQSEVAEEYIPRRLRGKTKEQIYKEFSGLESDYSRMGNELGEARSLLRETLEKALTANKVEEPPVTEEDILSNPKESVQKLIDAALKPVKDASVSAEQRTLMMEFNMRHPGYQETAKSPEFKDWLSESPYRTRLFTQASRFDLDAAEDLFTEYGSYQKSGTTDTNEKRREIRNASTETGGAGKSTSKTGKKVYKSTDLMRLYNTDRERYNDMSAEIQQAFQEGRVK